MSMQDKIIRNRLGKYIKRHLPADRHIQLNIKTEKNWTEVATRRFFENIIIQNDQWHEIITQHKNAMHTSRTQTEHAEKLVNLIINPVHVVSCTDQVISHTTDHKTIKSDSGIHYRFALADRLDVKSISEIMIFAEPAAARDFLLKLNPGYEKLAFIVTELGLEVAKSEFTKTAAILAALTHGMTTGNIVILREKSSFT